MNAIIQNENKTVQWMTSNENIYNTRFNQLCKNHLKYIMLK